MKKICITLFIVVIMAITLAPSAFAEFFAISEVEVNAVLNEDRSIEVTEVYSGRLVSELSTLSFKLPLIETIDTPTQSVSFNIDISDISLTILEGDEQSKIKFDTSVEGDDLIITTTDRTFAEGLNVIALSYHQDLGADNTIGADELFFRAVRPLRWTSMGTMSLTFEFPEPITADMVSVTSTADVNAISYSLDGNTLTANNLISIPEVHDVLLHAVLPDEYFLLEEETLFSFNPLIYTLCGAILAAALLIGIISRIKHRVKPGVVTHPPADFSPLELLLISGRKVTRRGVLGSVIGLACSGNVSISYGENGLIITKVKGSNLPQLQQQLFDLLFTDDDCVLLDKESLDRMIPLLQANTKKALDDSAELDDSITYGLCSAFLVLTGVVGGILGSIAFGFDYGFTRLLLMGASVGLPLIIGGHIMQAGFAARRKKRTTILHFIGFVINFAATGWGIFLMLDNFEFPMAAMMAATFLVSVFVACGGRRSRYFSEITADNYSLRKFLSTVSVQQLKSIVSAEPDYIYSVFSYAVCFSCEKPLLETYKKAEIPMPESQFLPSPFELIDVIPKET